MTNNDSSVYYKAYTARDRRFDGVFYIGVTSTGIYCRPICSARTPKQSNCHFFDSAAAAEKASFRPCLRCRPELAPGCAPVDDAKRIAHLIASYIEEGSGGDAPINLDAIAARFDLSTRQIRRIVQAELGVSPIDLIQTRRLLLAKQLLTETKLPITEVAFASGFSSLRRFNDSFQHRYDMPPSRLRKQENFASQPSDTLTLQLSYRPPYDWAGVLKFLEQRTLRGVELVEAETYTRTVQIGMHCGAMSIGHLPEKHAITVEFSHALMPVLPTMLARVRHLFDLSASPDLINGLLMQDPLLKTAVQKNQGLRVPGAFSGFELALRAILGQQVSVKAATTLAGRFVTTFGQMFDTSFTGLNRLSPTAERVAAASVNEIAELGIVGARAKSIISLAEACARHRLTLDMGASPDAVIAQLQAIPGIGPWTAHYIAMRALRWPDAFPKEDIAIRNKFGGVSAKRAEEMSQKWRPWRSYAVLHIWQNL